MKDKKPPSGPSATQLAGQQRTENQNTAQANFRLGNPNQTDQFGNQLTFSQSGKDANGNPIYAASQSLGEMGQQFSGGLAGLGQRYFDGANDFLDNPGQIGSDAAFGRAYDYATANLEPRFQRSEDQLRTRLANQGFDQSSEAYKDAVGDLSLQQNEARNDLVSSLQGQMFSQGLQERQQQIGELSGLTAPGVRFGGQTLNVNTAPYAAPQMPTVDVAGLAQQQHQNDLSAWQQQQSSRNAMLGGLASIGGTVAGYALAPMTGGASLMLPAAMGGGSALGMPSKIY